MVRFFLASLCLLALSGPVAAQSEVPAETADIQLEYTAFPVNDPVWGPIWQDYTKEVPENPVFGPEIYAVTMPTSGGGTFSISTFVSSGTCGINTCDVRIIENGEILADFMACNARETHRLSADGSRFIACDQEYDIEAMHKRRLELVPN